MLPCVVFRLAAELALVVPRHRSACAQANAVHLEVLEHPRRFELLLLQRRRCPVDVKVVEEPRRFDPSRAVPHHSPWCARRHAAVRSVAMHRHPTLLLLLHLRYHRWVHRRMHRPRAHLLLLLLGLPLRMRVCRCVSARARLLLLLELLLLLPHLLLLLLLLLHHLLLLLLLCV
jgi:hypothetical protein